MSRVLVTGGRGFLGGHLARVCERAVEAFRWAELACRSLGTEHLGLHVGCETPIEDLGPYGRELARARTLQQYLRQGISLYGAVVTGQRFWC